MNPLIFNACMLLGWLMVLAGGVMIDPARGLVGAGALLIVQTLIALRVAGPAREGKAA